MKKLNSITSALKTRLVLASGLAIASVGSAQTSTGAIDLSSAQTSTTAIIGVGVAITTALTVYGLGKRAANRA